MVQDYKLIELSNELLTFALQDSKSRDELLIVGRPSMFYGVNNIIFSLLYERRGVRNNTDVTERVENLIDENYIRIKLGRTYSKYINTANVDIDLFDSENLRDSVIGETIKQFNLLKSSQVKSTNIRLLFDSYLNVLETSMISETLEVSTEILTEGVTIRGKHHQGLEPTVDYLKRSIIETEALKGAENEHRGIRTLKEMYAQSQDDSVHETVGSFTHLPGLQSLLGGIKSGMLYTVMGPPKGGKSKFTIRLAYDAAVEFGTKSLIFPIENGDFHAYSELRAMHFEAYKSKHMGNAEVRSYGATAIENGMFDDDSHRQLEALSNKDLAYGPLSDAITIINGNLHVDTFIDEIRFYVETTGAKLVVVDYLGIIEGPAKSVRHEIIAMAYKKLIILAKEMDIAIFTPVQYKQAAVDKMYAGEDLDLLTAASDSGEAVRTPDVIIPMYGTLEEIEAGEMRILPIQTRKGFIAEEHMSIDLDTNMFVARPSGL